MALLASVVVLPLLSASARAQTAYTFTDVADTRASGTFIDFGLTPNLNDSGLVVFTGQLAAGGDNGVFASFGPVGTGMTTVATSAAGGSLAGYSFDTPRVNTGGTVVFRAESPDIGASGIYARASAGGRVTTLVDNSGSLAGVFGPSLNNAGQVAFAGVSASNGQPGIYRLGPSATIGAAPTNFTSVGTCPFVNSVGAVAFVADRTGAGTGTDVLVGNGSSAPVALVSTGAALGLASIDLGVAPQVSNDGRTVTFLGTRMSGSRGVFQFTLGSTALVPLVETANGLFSDVSNFSLAGGRFAFLGTITPTALDPDGTRGLFNGSNPVLNRIVTEGDLLTVDGNLLAVNSLGFADGGLNDNGQVSFYAGFSDPNNTAAIFRADVATIVPEPGSLALLLAGAATGLVLRRRRSSHL